MILFLSYFVPYCEVSEAILSLSTRASSFVRLSASVSPTFTLSEKSKKSDYN